MRLTSHSRIGASADCLANDRSTQSTVMTPASPTFFQGRPSTSASNCVRLSVAVVAASPPDAVAEAARAVDAYHRAWAQHLNGLDEQRRGLEEQVELYGLTEAQIAAVTLRRAEETLEVARANGVAADYLAALAREVALRREIAGAAGTLEAKRANAEAAQTAAREWERTAQEIEGAIYDAIVALTGGVGVRPRA